jgi:4-amino-4-deoxy-L-arabinose transferase-like glycosyltransferase
MMQIFTTTFVQRWKIVFLLLFLLSFFLLDLGNPDALRQGTEGFYLKISQEMFDQSSFLTPLYLGEPHWSKPPFHFWLALPFYKIFGNNLWAARLAILVFSLGGLWFIARWVRDYFSIGPVTTILFFCSAFGIFKYSRIYMMEMPLMLLSCLTVLFFYQFLQSNLRRDFIISGFLLGLSILVKGPISLVMAGATLAIFMFIFNTKKFPSLVLWAATGLLIATPWFLLSYLQHGQQFIDYFFLRENLGKFTSQSYPIKSLIQGLFLFSLPWSVGLPVTLYVLIHKPRVWINSAFARPLLLMIIGTIVFLSIWFFPSQRSHHYAMPAIPFFLILLLVTVFSNNEIFKITSKAWQRVYRIALWPIPILLLLLVIILSVVMVVFNWGASSKAFFILGLSLSCCLATMWVFIKQHTTSCRSFFIILCSVALWSGVFPLFYLPLLPQKIIQTIGQHSLSVVVRKPYFVESILQHKVTVISPDKIREFLAQGNNDYILLHESLYNDAKLADYAAIVERWPVWKRSNRFPNFIQALRSKDLSNLMEYMLLLQPK